MRDISDSFVTVSLLVGVGASWSQRAEAGVAHA